MMCRIRLTLLISLLLFLPAILSHAADPVKLEPDFAGLFRFYGASSFHLKDNYLITEAEYGDKLVIATFDISGDTPELVATTERVGNYTYYNSDFARVGDCLYVYRGSGAYDQDEPGIFRLDFSDPLHPVEKFFPSTGYTGTFFGGRGSVAYSLHNLGSRSYVITWDLSDPASPDSLAATEHNLSSSSDIQVTDDLLVVADSYQIRTYDPDTLELLGSLAVPVYQTVWGLAVHGGYAYLALYQNYQGLNDNAPSIEVVDLTDPAQPVLLDPLLLETQVTGLWYREGMLHGERYYDDYIGFNIDDPAHPYVAIGSEDDTPSDYMFYNASTGGFAVQGGRLFVYTYLKGLMVWDLADLTLAGQYNPPYFYYDNKAMTLVNGALYIPLSVEPGFLVAGLDDPLQPEELGVVTLAGVDVGRDTRTASSNNWLHVYHYQHHYGYRLSSYDASDPLQPELVSEREVVIPTIFTYDGYPMVATDDLIIYAKQGIENVEVDGQYEEVRRDTLTVESMTTPGLSHEHVMDEIGKIVLANGVLYIANRISPYDEKSRHNAYVLDLYALDPADPSSTPTVVFQDLSQDDYIVQPYGDYLIVSEDDIKTPERLVLLDISDPFHPDLVVQVELNEGEYQVIRALEDGILHDGLLFDNGYYGVDIYAADGLPWFSDQWYTEDGGGKYSNTGLLLDGSLMYRATRQALRVYDLQDIIGVQDPGQISSEAVEESWSYSYVFPNPARTEASVRIHMPHSGIIDLKVYNILGRLAWHDRQFQLSGWQTLTFDVQRFSSGFYYVHGTFPDGARVVSSMIVMK